MAPEKYIEKCFCNTYVCEVFNLGSKKLQETGYKMKLINQSLLLSNAKVTLSTSLSRFHAKTTEPIEMKIGTQYSQRTQYSLSKDIDRRIFS